MTSFFKVITKLAATVWARPNDLLKLSSFVSASAVCHSLLRWPGYNPWHKKGRFDVGNGIVLKTSSQRYGTYIHATHAQLIPTSTETVFGGCVIEIGRTTVLRLNWWRTINLRSSESMGRDCLASCLIFFNLVTPVSFRMFFFRSIRNGKLLSFSLCCFCETDDKCISYNIPFLYHSA